MKAGHGIFRTLRGALILGVGVACVGAPAAEAAGRSPREGGAAKAATANAPETAAPAPEGFSGKDVYQILIGEIAFRRGEREVAAQAYQEVARRLGDSTLLARAVHFAIAAQQYESALETAQRWVALEPASSTAEYTLSTVLAGLKRYDEMLPHLERMLEIDAEERGRYFLHLSRLLVGEAGDKALAAAQKLSSPYPDLPEARFFLASVARAVGNNAVALEAARDATRLRPGWSPAAFLEAHLVGTPAGAIEVWSRFLEVNKEFEPAYVQRARLYAGEKRYEEARADYEAALVLKPAAPETLYALAFIGLQLGDRFAAEKYFRRLEGREVGAKGLVEYQLGLLALDRSDSDTAHKYFSAVTAGDYFVRARSQLAQMLARQGKIDEARQFLLATVAASPEDQARLTIAEAYLLREAKRYQPALEIIEKALAQTPDDPDLLYDKAMIAEKMSRYEMLESALGRLIELNPNHSQALNALGYSWADRNVRLEEAKGLIGRALELAPRDPFILDSMGWVMFRLGRPETALEHLEEAFRQRPDPEIAAHVGEVLWSLGRRDEARKIWLESRQRFPENDVLGAVIEKFQP